MNKIISIVDLLIAFIKFKLGKVVFVKYYSRITNVGDVLNLDLIEHYSNKKVLNTRGCSKLPHYLVVGSVIHNMNEKTTVLGSGLIEREYINHIKSLGQVKVVRGELTKKALEENFDIKLDDLPLGDPAVLFPKIYLPEVSKTHSLGLVLHYVDEDHPIKEVVIKLGGKIISVRQSPKSFIDELMECDHILSSSMHGLILADSYGIKNKRIILSDKITGGDYKFIDYYSTTNRPYEDFLTISNEVKAQDITDCIKKCTVKTFTYDIDKLEKVFLEENF
ncbi:polysaccharide pyruvyl transferase family protein [Vibrio rarus]|uniref:polysaccharide pyruvyl transferase family protein n=1 Tax=Vibrio rarus TaxID=413403 RepID=UPI0021C40DBB|nr:polysaccharide pyruvyl transferase family protein [Vibrio rarus]